MRALVCCVVTARLFQPLYRPAVGAMRVKAVIMGPRKRGQDFYDDEQDTVSKPFWNWRQDEIDQAAYQSAEEQAGFGEGGEDLALVGLAPYLAFVPFLLVALTYLFGGGGSGPYNSSGNF
jgi:hypothetical protein